MSDLGGSPDVGHQAGGNGHAAMLGERPPPHVAPDTVRDMRRTKIVATIGPASREPETLVRLVEAGMDVARLNYSHGTLEEHAETIRRVRDAAQPRLWVFQSNRKYKSHTPGFRASRRSQHFSGFRSL